MDFEFDKEIDVLLRQSARGGETAFAATENRKSQIANRKSIHLDADEISLFAENVLPAARRANAMEHLADCLRCRKVLAEFIRLASDENPAAESATVKPVAVSIPWYKSLFAFPKFGYAMGALALVFSGLLAFFVLQNSRQTENASMAQMEKTDAQSSEMKSAPAEMSANSNASMAAATASTANSNMTSAILSANTANAASNIAASTDTTISRKGLAANGSAGTRAANANITTEPRDEVSARQTQNLPTTTTTESLTMVSPKKEKAEPAPPAPRALAKPAARENDYRVDGANSDAAKSSNEMAQNSAAQNQQNISPGAQSVRRANTQTSRSVAKEEEERADRKKSRAAVPSKTAGGKVFKFADGAWYDSAYNNQRTVNVRRGTAGYKKLDAPLRSIADQIGGIVVVAWKGNAYRIQ